MEQLIKPAIKKPCKIGKWQFYPIDGKLKSVDNSVKLQPRLSLLLSIFIANVNALIPREKLIEILWKDKIVNEDALSRCIAELRSALGDERQNPKFIETIPKKGYRFIYQIGDPNKKVKMSLITLIPIMVASIVLIILNSSSYIKLDTVLQKGLTNTKRLTTDDIVERTPEISPNGKLTAFSVKSNNKLAVRVIDINGKILHTIADNANSIASPSFSADSQSLTVAVMSQKAPCTIYHYDLKTKSRFSLGECIIPNHTGIFSWSSDGKFLAYVASDPVTKTAAIWLYDATKQTRIQLTSPNNSGNFDSRPRFSIKNNKLAFTRGNDSVRNIALIKLDNPTKVFQVTEHKNYISSFSWLKDNKHLIFDSDKRGDRYLWLIDSQTQKETLLGARDAQFPSLSADNSILTYLDIHYQANIWSVNLSDNNDRLIPLTRSIKYNNMPTFSPDGSQIAFTSNRQGKAAIWIYSIITNKQRKLFSLEGENLMLPSWSANGDKLLVSYKSETEYGCYQYNITNQHYESVGKLEKAYYSCIYGPNDSIFAITKEENEAPQIIKIKTNKTIEQITSEGVNRIMILNDRTLIYSFKNKGGLQIMTFSGEKENIVLPNFPANLYEHWTVKNGTIYYPKLQGKRGIWRYEVDSGEDTFVSKHLPSTIGNTLAISPDKKTLLISRTDRVDSDIFITTLDFEQGK
jgi:Tol biopolymer transport system component/DNA-binding winged helix-turn-helix (wHTH) protein